MDHSVESISVIIVVAQAQTSLVRFVVQSPKLKMLLNFRLLTPRMYGSSHRHALQFVYMFTYCTTVSFLIIIILFARNTNT